MQKLADPISVIVWNGQDEAYHIKKSLDKNERCGSWYRLVQLKDTYIYYSHKACSQDRWLTTTPKYSDEHVLWPSCQYDLEDYGRAFNRSYSTTPDHNRTTTFFWKYFTCSFMQLQRNPSTNFWGVSVESFEANLEDRLQLRIKILILNFYLLYCIRRQAQSAQVRQNRSRITYSSQLSSFVNMSSSQWTLSERDFSAMSHKCLTMDCCIHIRQSRQCVWLDR